MTERRDNPVDQLVENLVYAPVGLALEARSNWSTYIERGRSQVTISRFLARAATRKGASTAESIADRLANDVGQVIVGLLGIDLTPDADAAPGPFGESEFPIADYDQRTAADLTTVLPELSPPQLEQVRARELDGKSRVTVLRAVDRLLGSA